MGYGMVGYGMVRSDAGTVRLCRVRRGPVGRVYGVAVLDSLRRVEFWLGMMRRGYLQDS